jgi:uncharacterized Zn-finger protein
MYDRAVERLKPCPQGQHEHQCPWCKTVWRHADILRGSETAHTCPGCNRQFWVQRTEGYYGAM